MPLHLDETSRPGPQAIDWQRVAKAYEARTAELEAAVLAAKVLLEPTTDDTEKAWQVLDDAYHRQAK